MRKAPFIMGGNDVTLCHGRGRDDEVMRTHWGSFKRELRGHSSMDTGDDGIKGFSPPPLGRVSGAMNPVEQRINADNAELMAH